MIQSYYYRYEDYGQLIWDDGWQQAVSWDRRRNGLESKFVYGIHQYMNISPFFTWEKTGEYDHEVEGDVSNPELLDEIRVLRDEQVKMYFSVEVSFYWRSNSRLVSSVSHRLRKFNNRPRETNNYARITVEYLF